MHQLIILRGAPGSGKSTFAEKLRAAYPEMDYQICEADQYFMVDGEYRFDPSKLGIAHRQCYSNVVHALTNQQGVIVSNTNTRLSELEPYFEVAAEFGVVPSVITLASQYKSIHGVPDAKVFEMKNRIELNSDVSSLYFRYFQDFDTTNLNNLVSSYP